MPSRGSSSTVKSPVTTSPGIDKSIEESRHALKQLIEDFTNYKKEKIENER